MTLLNSKNKIWYVSILLILAACTTPTVTVHTKNPVTISVEIADEPVEHARGLMHRDYLPENQGMLFVFNEAKPLTFWMKNMRIPLDIIFIANNTVVSVLKDLPPCKQEQCPTYWFPFADKVLEINAGFAEKNQITVGTKVSFSKYR